MDEQSLGMSAHLKTEAFWEVNDCVLTGKREVGCCDAGKEMGKEGFWV
jgi:hypothetical protein